jgi:hypothetical protein
MTPLLPAYTPHRAVAVTIGATLAVIVGDARQRVRRTYAIRVIALKALIAALWRTLVDALDPFEYRVGQWVFAPARRPKTLLAKRADVELRIPRKIARCWRHSGKKYYTMVGFPEAFREDELEQYEKTLQFARPTQAVAAA